MPYTLLFGLVLGQALPVTPADSSQLERIRKALAESPAVQTPAPSDEGRPVFRVEVVRKSDRPLWDRPTSVPPYVFPPTTGLHYEFLNEVTPEYFRASTVYPVGIPVGSLIRWFVKATREERRQRREKTAREEIRQALADLAKARQAAGLPPRD